jgi:hypothetical protein
MTEQRQDAIRKELADLFAAAGLAVSDAEMDRMVGLVAENRAAGDRVRKLVERYDEPAFGFPSRRRP